ncbi:pyridoxamine 5'-phosphate oxidase family protein, partial [Klebsiella pneumoniae]|uniref:pyridoxamine 5'-phosphate oxidase family protein n=1 Tax=Klebsiella pneumoniae TaxID=573 RepID=UPI0025A26640
ASGAPCVRTVVLRGFDPAFPLLTVHTDLRAAKTAQVRANPLVALHAWDDAAQTQLRIGGRAALHAADARAEAEWGRLHGGSRATYAVADAPGTPISDPAAVGRVPDEAAFAHFAVVDVAVLSLEWLLLAQERHRRARFTFEGAGTATWLV